MGKRVRKWREPSPYKEVPHRILEFLIAEEPPEAEKRYSRLINPPGGLPNGGVRELSLAHRQIHFGRSRNRTHFNMTNALIAIFTIVSIFSVLFIVRRYRTATPAQRSQIIWAACGAVAVAAGVICLSVLR